MSDQLSIALHVLALSDNGVQVATQQSTGWAFWLPRQRSIAWAHEPTIGKMATCIVPLWLAAKHKQLSSGVEFERSERVRNAETQKELDMTDKQEDAGHGALFKNTSKEKPNHPDYKGDVTINGKKFWVSAWIKEGQKGKYMSLAFRRADDSADTKSKPSAKAMADVDMPF